MEGTITPEALAQALILAGLGGQRTTYKAAGTTPVSVYGHGPGGTFSPAGLSPDVYNAMLLPELGLQALLPARPSRELNPLHGIFTGVTADSGSQPIGVCDPPKTGGLSKLCTHSFVFSRVSRQTPPLQLDRVGALTNRGEFTDLSLIGNPFQAPTNSSVPSGVPGMNEVLRGEAQKSIFELMVSWARGELSTMLYRGNPANNTAGGGYEEFWGLDKLINTGYRDAITQQACPAADSIVHNFAGQNVSTAGGQAVRALSYIMRNLRFIAERAGLAPVEWAYATRRSLFFELTAVWPCAYETYRCTFSGNDTRMLNPLELNRMTDDMRNRQYLIIDGKEYPVVFDEGILELSINNTPTFLSDIYIVPLRAAGRQVTFFEYFDFDGPYGALEAAKLMAPGDSYYTTNNGRFLWHKKPPTEWCVQMSVLSKPRLILETPHLAARITNVSYSPLMHERSSYPDDPYFADGGRTNYTGYGPSYYSPTA